MRVINNIPILNVLLSIYSVFGSYIHKYVDLSSRICLQSSHFTVVHLKSNNDWHNQAPTQLTVKSTPYGQGLLNCFKNTHQTQWRDDINKLVMHLHLTTNITVRVISSNMSARNIRTSRHVTVNMYIIFLEINDKNDIQDFNMFINIMKVSNHWNVRAFFFVAIENTVLFAKKSDVEKYEIVENILNILKKSEIFKTIVLMSSNKYSNDDSAMFSQIDPIRKISQDLIQIYTWFPYKENKCNNAIKPILISHWFIREEKLIINKDIFSKNIPIKLYNCTLKVSTFHLEPFVMRPEKKSDATIRFKGGLEIEILNVLANIMNFNVLFQPISRDSEGGQLLPKDTFIEIVNQVLNKQSSVAFGSLILQADYLPNFDFTFSYLEDKHAWYVPKASPIPKWMSLSKTFSTKLWLTVILSWIGIIVFIYFLWNSTPSETSLKYTTSEKSLSDSFIFIWSMILENPIFSISKQLRYRTFIFLWVFFCFIINASYRCKLISVLTNPGYQHQISTLDELLHSGMEFGYHPTWDLVYADDSDPRSVRIVRDRQLCLDLSHCMNKIVKTKNFAMMVMHSIMQFRTIGDYVDDQGVPLTVPLREKVKNIHKVMILAKGSHLWESFDWVIHRLVEGGFVDKWYQNILVDHMMKNIIKFGGKIEGSLVILTLHHLQGAFCFLAIGLGIAMSVFLVEIAKRCIHQTMTKY